MARVTNELTSITVAESGARSLSADDDLLPAIVERMVRLVDPLQIVLFGSRALGHARPDSDYDVLVVLDEVRDRRGTRIRIRRALADLPVSLDVTAAARSELSEDHHGPRGIVQWAAESGRLVYERPARGGQRRAREGRTWPEGVRMRLI